MEDLSQDSPRAPTPVERIRQLFARTFTLRALLWVVLCTAVGTAIGYYNAKRQPYRWRVSALVLATIGREFGSARSEIVVAGGSSHVLMPPSKEHLNTEVELARSPELMRKTYESLREDDDITEMMRERREKQQPQKPPGGGASSISGTLSSGIASLLRTLDLTYEPDIEDQRFESWAGALNVGTVPRSNLIAVQCTVTDPELGKRFLERWLKMYEEHRIAAYSQADATALFENQLEELEQTWMAAEKRLTELRKNESIFDIDKEKNALIDQRERIRTELRRLEGEIDGEEKRLATLEQQLGSGEVPEFSVSSYAEGINPNNDMLERNLLQIQMDIDRMITLRTQEEDDTEVRRLVEQRAALLEFARGNPALQERRDSGKTTSRDPVYSQLEQDKYRTMVNLAGLRQQVTKLEEQEKALTGELIQVEERRWEHTRAQDMVATARADWAQVKEGVRIGRMNATLDQARISNVRPVSKPTVEPTPIQMMGLPHRVAITGMGGLFGLALAIGTYLFLVTLREAGFLPRRRRDGELATVTGDVAGDDELWMVEDGTSGDDKNA